MLVRFVVSNYLSFGEEVEFNMLTGSPRRFPDHVYTFDELELLKIAAIYGPNGAGKSNLVKAIYLLQQIVTSDRPESIGEIVPFRLSQAFYNQPTHLEVEFVKNGQIYNYGISILHNTIQEEWLYIIHSHAGKNKDDELIFNRTSTAGKTTIEISDRYYVSEEDRLRIKLYEEELLQDDEPFIKLLNEAKQVFEEVRAAYEWFKEDLIIVFPDTNLRGLAFYLYLDKNLNYFANELLKNLDTGVVAIDFQTTDMNSYFGEKNKAIKDKINKDFQKSEIKSFIYGNDVIIIQENDELVVKRLITKHSCLNKGQYDFQLKEESDGTRRILDFIPAFYNAINYPKTILIDEIDQSVHPYLLKELISKFAADTATKGQLIFTTHESNLLDQDIFRQDEIWFAEKKPTGETTLYPLSEFDIRYDLDIRKGYLQGRFNAIPFLANLRDLNWDVYAETEPSI